MPRMIEFLVHGIVTGETGHLRVIGRCTEDPIYRGDSFSFVYQCNDERLADGREVPRRFDQKELDLRVQSAHAYGREMDFLDVGMTGTLDLTGTGKEIVVPGSLLGVPEQSPAQAAVVEANSNCDQSSVVNPK